MSTELILSVILCLYWLNPLVEIALSSSPRKWTNAVNCFFFSFISCSKLSTLRSIYVPSIVKSGALRWILDNSFNDVALLTLAEYESQLERHLSLSAAILPISESIC